MLGSWLCIEATLFKLESHDYQPRWHILSSTHGHTHFHTPTNECLCIKVPHTLLFTVKASLKFKVPLLVQTNYTKYATC